MKHIQTLLLSGYLGLSLLAAQDVPITRPAAYPPSDSLYSKDTIRLAAVGDIMLGSTYPSLSYLAPNDGRRTVKMLPRPGPAL